MTAAAYDRNKQRSYELAKLIASKLVADPSLIERGREHLDRHVKACRHQRRYYKLWSRLLKLEAQDIAARLLAMNAEGELLRDTRPVLYIPTNAERARAFDLADRSAR
ncbi:MAG TPA: hypothetical protein VG271_13245 [Beijerinckiaceae bacterium]|nr:hypothetical protein [Beijerinckiaceae bacterium]